MNFGLLFMITLVLLAAFRLPQKHPDIYAKSNYKFSPRLIATVSMAGVVINIIFMLILAVAMQWSFCIFIAAGVAGIALYFVRKRQIKYVPSSSTIEQAE